MESKKDILREIKYLKTRMDNKVNRGELKYFYYVKNPNHNPGAYCTNGVDYYYPSQNSEYFEYVIDIKNLISLILDHLDLELTHVDVVPEKHELVKRKK